MQRLSILFSAMCLVATAAVAPALAQEAAAPAPLAVPAPAAVDGGTDAPKADAPPAAALPAAPDLIAAPPAAPVAAEPAAPPAEPSAPIAAEPAVPAAPAAPAISTEPAIPVDPADPAPAAIEEKVAAPAPPPEPPAAVTVASADAPAPAEEPAQPTKPWSVSFDWGNSVGSATFISNEYIRASSWGMDFTLGGSYKIHDHLKLSSSLVLGVGLIANNQTATSYIRQPLFSDLRIGFGFGELYKIPVVDVSIKASANLRLPTSLASQFQTRRFAAGTSLVLAREIPGGVSFSYTFGFRKNNHRYTSPALDPSESPNAAVIVRRGGAESLEDGLISTGGKNQSFGISNVFEVSWSVPWVEGLSATANYGVANGWYYEPTVIDQFSSPNAKEGSRAMDLQDFNLDVSYSLPFFDYVTLSTGVGGVSIPTFAPSGQGYYFPLAAPLANDLYSYYFTASFAY